jgi:hypothetical protein
MAEVYKLFSMAFEQVCALKEVQRLFCPNKTCNVCRDGWACKRSFEHGRNCSFNEFVVRLDTSRLNDNLQSSASKLAARWKKRKRRVCGRRTR